MRTLHFFLDFDGTIATSDVVDMVLEKFADKKWRDIEKEWQSGKIGSRECLTRQIELLKAEPGQIAELIFRKAAESSHRSKLCNSLSHKHL